QSGPRCGLPSFPTRRSSELVPHPDADPDDCEGHGTHVAGIVGASGDPAEGGVRGVAPDAEIGAYRVFGCDGSTTADIMLAAMERSEEHTSELQSRENLVCRL